MEEAIEDNLQEVRLKQSKNMYSLFSLGIFCQIGQAGKKARTYERTRA